MSVSENISSLASALFGDLSVSRRWLLLAVTLTGVVLISVAYEWYTEFRYLENLHERAIILKDLASIPVASSDPALSAVRLKLLDEIKAYEPHRMRPPLLAGVDTTPWWKVLSGSSLGLLGLLIAWFNKGDDRNSTMIGSIMALLAGGLFAYSLPTLYDPWVNYLGVPTLYAVMLIAYSAATKKKASASQN